MATHTLEQRLLTVDEYHAMARAGILTEDDRVELLDGKIIVMSPIGPPHIRCVIQLDRLLNRRIDQHDATDLFISVQNPVRLDIHGEPEPDVVLLRLPEGPLGTPRPDDVLLLIEVADTSLAHDRDIKLPRYARAGIPEAWIVALDEDHIEVYRRPQAQGYAERQVFQRGEALEIEALPTLGTFSVDAILGT